MEIKEEPRLGNEEANGNIPGGKGGRRRVKGKGKT